MTNKLAPDDLINLLRKWTDKYLVFVPDEHGRLMEYEDGLEIDWHTVPIWHGIKEFVFPARNLVAGVKKR